MSRIVESQCILGDRRLQQQTVAVYRFSKKHHGQQRDYDVAAYIPDVTLPGYSVHCAKATSFKTARVLIFCSEKRRCSVHYSVVECPVARFVAPRYSGRPFCIFRATLINTPTVTIPARLTAILTGVTYASAAQVTLDPSR